MLYVFRTYAVAYDVTLQRRIRELCAQAVAVRDSEECQPILAELQQLLRQHIQQLQSMVIEYPFSPTDVSEIAPPDGTQVKHKKAM
jgi:hypothetical protein